MKWLDEQMNRGILDILPGETKGAVGNADWADVYIDAGYKKGMRRADAELIKAGITPTRQEQALPIEARFAQPIPAAKVAAIYIRTYTDLKGVTDTVGQIMSQELAVGLAEGQGPRTIARRLKRE